VAPASTVAEWCQTPSLVWLIHASTTISSAVWFVAVTSKSESKQPAKGERDQKGQNDRMPQAAHSRTAVTSTSNGTLSGSSAMPMEVRACRPLSPKARRKSSEAPLAATWMSVKPGAQLQ
jgi:murein endopeptidase